jgi:hypothetical protein
MNWLYPLRIPQDPKICILNAEGHVISERVILNRHTLVGLLGEQRKEDFYRENTGEFLFAVGGAREERQGRVRVLEFMSEEGLENLAVETRRSLKKRERFQGQNAWKKVILPPHLFLHFEGSCLEGKEKREEF